MLHTAATQGMAVVHLQQRGFTFVWRRRIPQDLVSRWKRRELTKSSQQTDRAEALRVARRLSLAADNIFAIARNMPDLTTEQLDQLARDYFEDAIERDEAQRLRPSTKRGGAYIEPTFPDQCPIDADQSRLEDLLGETQEQIANNDFRQVAPQVLAVLEEAGLQVDTKSDTFRALAQRILRAQAEAMRIAYERRAGNYTVQPQDPLFSWAAASVSRQVKPKVAPRLSEVASAFVATRVRDGKWKEITKRNSTSKLNFFVETLKDPKIDAISRRPQSRGLKTTLTDLLELHDEGGLAIDDKHFRASAAPAKTEKASSLSRRGGHGKGQCEPRLPDTGRGVDHAHLTVSQDRLDDEVTSWELP